MKLTYKFNFIDNSNTLSELCKHSKNLYNQANYIIKKELRENKKWIRYNKLNSILIKTENLKKEINYKLLKAQVSQQILRLLDKNWCSYFKSIKDYKKNPSKYKGQPKPPKYIKKTDKNILIYTNQCSKIKDNKLYFNKNFSINIPVYKDKDFTKFQQIRILPKQNNNFEIEIIYNQNIKSEKLNYEKYASIDLGLSNLITMVSENKPILFNGDPLKSYNQFYNKQKSKLLSIKDKMKIKSYTRRLYGIENNRNNFIKDYLHKVSRLIINYLITNEIGNLVVGKNNSWKDSINLGKKNNQTFVSIPHSKLVNYLKYKCELCGIKLIETEESYTSKCDSLALEKVGKHEKYLGKRVKRGLFQSSVGKLINADVNGAVNILRKVVDDFYVNKIINSGFLFNPIKIRNLFSNSLQRKMLNLEHAI